MGMQNWLISPWSNPLAPEVGLLLGLVFGGAGLALVVVGLVGRPRLANGTQTVVGSGQRVLWQRYRTWAVIAPLFAGTSLSGPVGLAGLVLLISWFGGREYAGLVGLPRRASWAMTAGSGLTVVATLVLGGSALMIGPVAAFFGWAAFSLLPTGESGPDELTRRMQGSLNGLWGYLYLGWLPAHLLALGSGPRPGLVLAVGLGVALSDVGAFVAGKTIGGPKLAPLLSPNKTWGGLVGNLAGAGLAVALIAFALPGLTLWQGVALVVTIGLGSVWGDLLESLFKRQRGVKDAGRLLPGFGGLLDRVDSLLLVAPLVYYLSVVVF